jgi:hypothetical protein
MFKIRFSFLNGTSEYYWIKKLYSKEESNILSYLESKSLPFEELTIKDIKWKVIT